MPEFHKATTAARAAYSQIPQDRYSYSSLKWGDYSWSGYINWATLAEVFLMANAVGIPTVEISWGYDASEHIATIAVADGSVAWTKRPQPESEAVSEV
jgi:hypothetical protein